MAAARSSTDGGSAHTRSLRATPSLLLFVVGLGIFFGTLDQTVIVTVLPDVIRDIRLPVNTHFGQASWIVNGYLLGYTIAMPLVGKIADVHGRVRVFLLCLALFATGSVFVALSPNLPLLVAARGLQAIGGGGLLPIALAVAADVTSPRRRAVALGALAATNNGSTFLGPVWGAAIAGLWNWRTIFWLNVPLILPCLLVMPLLARDSLPAGRHGVDWRGAALLALGLSACTFALTDDGANPRPVPVSVAIGAAGIVILVAFVALELHTARPMIDLRVLRLRRVAVAMLTYFLIGGALITALVSVPLMTDVLWGGSTTQGGLNLMRLLLLLPVGGVAGGYLATRIGYRSTVLLGLVMAFIGFVWMQAWPFSPGAVVASSPSSWQLWGALAAIGLGLGLCDGPIVATVVDAVHATQRATVSALLLVVWTCGMIVGLALLATQGLGAFSQRIGGIAFNDPTYSQRFQGVLHRTFDQTFIAASVALALAFLLAWGLGSSRAAELLISSYEGLGE